MTEVERSQSDDEAIGEAVDRLAAEHDHVTGKRPLARKSPDFEAEAAYWLRYYYLYSLSASYALCFSPPSQTQTEMQQGPTSTVRT